MAKFFISCAINLEELALKELKLKWPMFLDSPLPEINLVKGGLELECEIPDGLALNLILKIPTRILLRLKEQKCRDIPKLYNIVRKFPWKQYLKKEKVKWHITTQQSRLIHSKKIEKACADGLNDFFKANALPEKIKNAPNFCEQQVFIRINEDLLTLSLDTSGELLHIRGNRSFRGHASLRETYAAACIYKLVNDMDETNSLLDPMFGTGTFLSEAHDFFLPTQRSFPFFDWCEPSPLKSTKGHWRFKNYHGRDIDSLIVDKCELSFVEKKVADIFQSRPEHFDVVICNPPYGKRVKLDIYPVDYFNKLLSVMLENYSPIRLGILIPHTIRMDFKKLPAHYKLTSTLPFNNNGIKVNFYVINKY
jgi:putative N6-adenine-specific DNA methylase